MINIYTYLLAIFSALISSLRFSYLPELQFIVLLFIFFVLRSKVVYAIGLITVLCTNTYAIPDAILRLTPEVYPSIYTKSIISSIKVIDLLVILTFFASIRSFPNLLRIKGIQIPALVFLIAFFSTLISVFFGVVGWGYFLFYIRGALLAVGMFCLVSEFSKYQLIDLLYFSMFCWVFKMIFMIIFPSEHVIQREIFGFQWKIFFAGDEYLYFGLISSCIICLVNFSGRRKIYYKKCLKYCAIALLLAIISQRKGAIPYFLISFVVMYCSYKGSLFLRVVSNSILIVYASLFFLFFVFVYPNIPEIYQLAFSEYHVLYVSAVDSIVHMFDYNPYGVIFGVGAMGLYEVISLPDYADHAFSFGDEVGNVYRYAIWNLPFGRLAINVGLIGFFAIAVFLISKLTKLPTRFYIYFSIIPLFAMYGVTPISAIYIGFSLAVLYKTSSRII